MDNNANSFYDDLDKSLTKMCEEEHLQGDNDGWMAPNFPYCEDPFAEEFGNRASNEASNDTSQVKERENTRRIH